MKKQTNKFYVPCKPMYFVVIDKNRYIPLGRNKFNLTKISYKDNEINLSGNDYTVNYSWETYFATLRGDLRYGEYGQLIPRKYEFYRDNARIHPTKELSLATNQEKMEFEKEKERERKKWKNQINSRSFYRTGHAGCSGMRSPKCIHYLREMSDPEYGHYVRAGLKKKDWSDISWETPRSRRSFGWKEQSKKRHQWER